MKMKTRYFFLAAVPLALLLFNTATARTAQRSDAVRVVPNGRSAAGTPGQKGATYYALENQSSRVTTEFLDGSTAVAERSLDGDLVANLRNAAGLDINRVRVSRKGGPDDAVQYFRPGADAIQALLEADAHPTLDWSNRQSYRFYQDNVTSAANLRWQNGAIRRNGAGGGEDDEAETVKSIETIWPDGLSAKTHRSHLKPGDTFGGKPVTGDVLITIVQHNGANVGVANYFVNEKIYAWRIARLTEGVISNEHLKPHYGGWLFRPDMIWMNLQALGFYQWAKDRPATHLSACAAKPSLIGRLAALVAPIVHAEGRAGNEDGCDDLHWLDGTTYRFCCDIHDLCYEKNGCSSSSWWQVWTSWKCDRCNAEAVWCFAGGGTGEGPMYLI